MISVRLIDTNTGTLKLFNRNVPKYAVFAHAVGRDDITYPDMVSGEARKKGAWHKIENACALARSRKISHIWTDSCCIDRRNSFELSEMINSMFTCYQGAHEVKFHRYGVSPLWWPDLN